MKNKPRFILNIVFIAVLFILLLRFIYYQNIFISYPWTDRQFFNTLTLVFIYIGLGINVLVLFVQYSILRLFSLILGMMSALFTLIFGMLFCYFDMIYFDIYAPIWLVLHVILGNLAIGLKVFGFIF
ncbi:MAG: hypothetical protein ACTSPY_11885 [Candidatus Helarchaeota archaeon]